jgi:putative endonuclease
LVDGFTKKYDIDKLGYYEAHSSIASAIEREKQIKGGSRKSKLALIENTNPEWTDLYTSIL